VCSTDMYPFWAMMTKIRKFVFFPKKTLSIVFHTYFWQELPQVSMSAILV